MTEGKFYYCTKHKTVEGEEGCRAADRLGPYDTAEEASHALEIAAARTKSWDNDPEWNDDSPAQDEPAQDEPAKE